VGAGRWFGQEAWARAWERRSPLVEALVPAVLQALAPQPGERILDVGTGAAQLAVAVARTVGAEGSVTGIDISPPVLRIAEERAREARVSNAHFLPHDASSGGVTGAPFAAATSLLGVMFFRDPVVAFGNIRRQVGTGGRLAFGAWSAPERNPLLVERLLGHYASTPDWNDAGPNHGSFSLANPERVQAILDAAGWTDVRCAEVELKPVVSPNAVFDRELLDLYGVPPERQDEALAHVEAEIGSHRVDAGIAVPLALNVVRAWNHG
jgi:SAM-dependent methyltransferase